MDGKMMVRFNNVSLTGIFDDQGQESSSFGGLMGKTYRRGAGKEKRTRPVHPGEAGGGNREAASREKASGEERAPFFIDKTPDHKDRVREGKPTLEAVPSPAHDIPSEEESPSSSCIGASDAPRSESNDEEFASLVREYKALMCGDDENVDLEWSLDETAARILRDRKASDPKYAGMSSEEFDQVVCFDEIYGKRHRGANLAARLQRARNGESTVGTSTTPCRHQTREEEMINFRQLNRDIKEFVRHEDVGEQMELDPHPPPIRKLVHELAHMYGLSSKSKDSGVDRHCVLVKGEGARVPRDLCRLDKFLDRAQKASRYIYHSESAKDRKGPKAGGGKGGKASGAAAKVIPGAVVGGEAAPIEEENVGNRMLRKLGWSPGQGLGSAKSGRTDPVEAVYKGNRSGLGH